MSEPGFPRKQSLKLKLMYQHFLGNTGEAGTRPHEEVRWRWRQSRGCEMHPWVGLFQNECRWLLSPWDRVRGSGHCYASQEGVVGGCLAPVWLWSLVAPQDVVIPVTEAAASAPTASWAGPAFSPASMATGKSRAGSRIQEVGACHVKLCRT